VKALFVGAFSAFRDVMEREAHSPFTPNQCEVSYINLIRLEDHKSWGQPGRWIRLWHDEPDEGEGVQFTTRHLLNDPDGQPFARLTTSLEGGQVGDRPVLQFNLMVKGRPLRPDESGVLSFFDEGHEAIVRRFVDVTTRVAQREWERV
jgi:hypothetical protein